MTNDPVSIGGPVTPFCGAIELGQKIEEIATRAIAKAKKITIGMSSSIVSNLACSNIAGGLEQCFKAVLILPSELLGVSFAPTSLRPLSRPYCALRGIHRSYLLMVVLRAGCSSSRPARVQKARKRKRHCAAAARCAITGQNRCRLPRVPPIAAAFDVTTKVRP